MDSRSEITNPVIHEYDLEPICESHMHIVQGQPIQETVEILQNLARYFGYSVIAINALPYRDITENYKALYCKSLLAPKVYVNAGLEHHFDCRDTKDFYLEEIKKYHAMGCDGMKMLEGKMRLHRKIGRRLDDPVFDLYYAYAEEQQIPIVLHCGDGLYCWDITKMSAQAIANGDYCTKKDPTREELRDEVDGILAKFPRLKLILAHMYFMTGELERAADFLDRHENVYFDLAPGKDIFPDFTATHEEWRKFIIKYQKRILYGTDTYSTPQGGKSEDEVYGGPINLVRTFLEKENSFVSKWLGSEVLQPFELNSEVLNRIYRKNFRTIYGEKPRELDYERIAAECIKYISLEDNLMRHNMQIISRRFGMGNGSEKAC